MDWENFSQVEWERLCQPQIWERGKEYYHEGALIAACKFDKMLAGQLIGSGMVYQARLLLEAGELHWECSCPYPDFCKHLAAVAFAWLQQPDLFEELVPSFETILGQPDEVLKLFKQLVIKNPFDFIALSEPPLQRGDFLNRRELLNVVRNLCQRPLRNISEAESLWERVQGVGHLLRPQIIAGVERALEPLRLLWDNLIKTYQNTPFELLKLVLVDQLELIERVAHSFSYQTVEAFWDILYQQSMEPGLWELGPELRRTLHKLALVYPQLIGRLRENISASGYLQWAANYELGLLLPKTPETRLFMEEVGEKLAASVTGRLWLIDRLMEHRPDEAFRLAKQGIAASAGADKDAFRERMIIIHQQRREFKQGAALAFLQFQATPSFDEYLRLKQLLRDFPQNFHGYYLQMGQALVEKCDYSLLVRIMVAEGDVIRLNRTLETMLERTDLLLEVLNSLTAEVVPEMLDTPVYPGIILALLDDGRRAMVKGARRLMIFYKTSCRQHNRLERWEEFLRQFKARFGRNPVINRQLGLVISE